MASYAKLILVGNCGSDPEVRYLQSGKQVASLSVAVSETWTDGDGKKKEHTQWYRARLYGEGLIEFVAKHVKKGDPVLLEGDNPRSEAWVKDGVAHSNISFFCSAVRLLGSRKDGSAAEHGRGDPDRGAGRGSTKKDAPPEDESGVENLDE